MTSSLSMWTSAVLKTNKHTVRTSGEVSGVLRDIILRLPLHTHSLCVVRLNAGHVSDVLQKLFCISCVQDRLLCACSRGCDEVLLHML